MKFDGFGNFLECLASEGQLVRIKASVDLFLEITEIADRVMKRGLAAVRKSRQGSSFPLAINAFGSRHGPGLARTD